MQKIPLFSHFTNRKIEKKLKKILGLKCDAFCIRLIRNRWARILIKAHHEVPARSVISHLSRTECELSHRYFITYTFFFFFRLCFSPSNLFFLRFATRCMHFMMLIFLFEHLRLRLLYLYPCIECWWANRKRLIVWPYFRVDFFNHFERFFLLIYSNLNGQCQICRYVFKQW